MCCTLLQIDNCGLWFALKEQLLSHCFSTQHMSIIMDSETCPWKGCGDTQHHKSPEVRQVAFSNGHCISQYLRPIHRNLLHYSFLQLSEQRIEYVMLRLPHSVLCVIYIPTTIDQYYDLGIIVINTCVWFTLQLFLQPRTA